MSLPRQFYLTLPSSSSLNIYPGNTLSNFTVKLPIPLDFAGAHYEVALCEIITSANIQTLSDKERELDVTRLIDLAHNMKIKKKLKTSGKVTKYKASPKKVIEKMYIPKGIYNNREELFDAWNAAFRSSIHSKDLKFTYSAHTLTLTSGVYPVNKPCCSVEISGKLFSKLVQPDLTQNAKLSFQKRYNIVSNNENYALKPPRIAFCYSDIVEHQIVGHSQLQLLRIIQLPVDDKVGYASVTFHDLHYVNLSKSFFESININISTVNGDNFPFTTGTLIVKLHFREVGQ